MIVKKGGVEYRNKKNKEAAEIRKEKEDVERPFHVKHKKLEKTQMVCGMRPVLEALEAGRQIDKILVQNNLDGSLAQELRKMLKPWEVTIQYVPVEKLNKLTSANHQGVVAMISPIAYHDYTEFLQRRDEGGTAAFVLLLDHVTDVRNLGAIVRTAECAGIDAVIVPDRGSAQINEEAVKTSSGALLRMPICKASNLKTVVNYALQEGFQVCAATEKGSVDYATVDFTKSTLLIMGAEDTGISPELLKLADVRACLPMRGEIKSLNVSVAAGVFLYEMLRQRSGV